MLVLTDGDIHDMKETKSLVVAASELPCAIVIHSFLNCRLEAVDLEKICKYREVGYGGSCIEKF